jgi:transposase
LRQRKYPWPEVIGWDEHAFKYDAKRRYIRWNTVIADHRKKRLYDLVEGRTVAELKAKLESTPGRENVKVVTMDLSTTFKSAAKELFPNAEIVADRFHVIKLFQDALKAAVGTTFGKKERPETSKLLFANVEKLSKVTTEKLNTWVLAYAKLSVLHRCKEEMRQIYRMRCIYERKREKFVRLLDEMAKSPHEEVRSLRATLFKWRAEILASMRLKWSNGRLEGYNSKAKLVKRTAFGFKKFENFRLRFLNACF